MIELAIALWAVLLAALLLISWMLSRNVYELSLGFVFLIVFAVCFIISFVITPDLVGTLLSPSFKLTLAALFQLSIIGSFLILYFKAIQLELVIGWAIIQAILAIALIW